MKESLDYIGNYFCKEIRKPTDATRDENAILNSKILRWRQKVNKVHIKTRANETKMICWSRKTLVKIFFVCVCCATGNDKIHSGCQHIRGAEPTAILKLITF